MPESAQLNILIETGTDFVLSFTVYDNNGNPVDLTGATVESQLREYAEAYDFFEFACMHNGNGGRITITMPHETTTLLPFTQGVYDVKVTMADGTISHPLSGIVYIKEGVTKSFDGSILFMLGINSFDDLPEVGNVDRLYFVYSDRKIYRWNGTNYIATSVGNGIRSISFVQHIDEFSDKYRITYDDSTTFDYIVTSKGIDHISKIGSTGTVRTGIIDQYRIHFNNSTTHDYYVANGRAFDVKTSYDATQAYEYLDMVKVDGATYVAVQDVPADTAITNTDYWLKIIAPLTMGTVTTVGAQELADASIGGTADAPMLNLTIPRGVTGNESIDDTKSIGDPDYVWSADKCGKLTQIHPNRPIAYTGKGWLYNGTNTASTDSYAEEGYAFTGFSRITESGTATNFTVVKEIAPSMQPNIADVDGAYIWFYCELAEGTNYLRLEQILLSTGNSWNASNTKFIKVTNVYIRNGLNRYKLSSVTGTSSSTKFSKMIVQLGSISQKDKIKNIYFYLTPQPIENPFSISSGWHQINNTFTNQGGTLGITYDRVGYVHKITIPDNGGTAISSARYCTINIPIKELFGKGYKLLLTVKNANTTSSYWQPNEVHLTSSAGGWSNNIVNLGSLGRSAYKEVIYDFDSYEIDPDDYTNIYFVLGFYQGNVAANAKGNSFEITFHFIPTQSEAMVLATKLLGFDQTEYYTKTEVDALVEPLEPESPTADLLFWGDSLTAGAGGGGTSYPNVCATELNMTYKNCGVGGENANTIAARQGGGTLIIPSGNINGTYPLTDFKDTFGGNIRPLRQGNGSNSGNKLYIKGEECTLSISQSSATDPNATYTISGYTGGASSIPLLSKFAGSDFTGKIVVIWVGQNGSSYNGDSDVNARISIIDSMISHIGHEKYVVLGLSSSSESYRAAEDKALFAHYGNKFMPVRKLLVQYGLTINGLTPTTQDTEDIASGIVPTSLRSDAVHMNAYGYTAIGKLLADQIRALGYV